MSRRGLFAALIVALWLGGLSLMVERNANRSDAQKLAEVALKLQPALADRADVKQLRQRLEKQ
jgi:hypothetical protein